MRTGRALRFAAIVAAGVTFALAARISDPFELPFRDFMLRLLTEHPPDHSVVVAIDEASLRRVGPWPWPRTTIAALVSRVADAGAQAVVLDILLADARPGDEVLAAAMRRLPTICVAALDEHGEWLLPAPALRSAVIAAHGNFEVDHDGILRRFASTKQSADRSLVALPVEASSVLTHAPVAVGRSIVPAFRTPAHLIKTISAADVLNNPALRNRLEGKLVFVGPTAFALGDRVLTPTSASHRPDPGVTVHAAATESMIRGEDVRTLPPLAGGVLAGFALLFVLGGDSRTMRVALTMSVLLIGGALLLEGGSIAIPVVTLVTVVALTVATVEGARLLGALRRGQTAASTMEQRLGMTPHHGVQDVGPRMESIASHLSAQRERDLDAKRVLAHELRTPLASMRNLSELLSDFALTEQERHRVGALLQSETVKLESLVGGLLEIERLPLRDFEASTTLLDLGELMATRIEFLRLGTNRTLQLENVPGILVRADASLLERMLDNLVGNALKYTSSTVLIRVLEREGAGILEVEDRGAGIPEVERGRMFERFVRGSSAAGTQGLGLGLSLVAEGARWHGGSVFVEAVEGGGSRFRVALPRVLPLERVGGIR